MAITDLTIVQNNSKEGVNLYSVHNPFIYIVRAVYDTSTPPDYILVSTDSEPEVYYKCIFLRDESATERDFYFIADEILRAVLGGIEYILQSDDTIIEIPNLTTQCTLTFINADYEEEEPITAITAINICNAARDFENVNGACLVDLYNNEQLTYTGAVGEQLYAYWYNNNADNVINGTEGVPIGVTDLENLQNLETFLIATYPLLFSTGITTPVVTTINPPSGGFSYFLKLAANGTDTLTFTVNDLGHNINDDGLFQAPISYQLVNNGTVGAFLNVLVSDTGMNNVPIDFDFTVNAGAANEISTNYGITGGDNYAKGFIRKAISPTLAGNDTISININGVDYAHDLIIREFCDGDIILKYLDRNGQYRVMPFAKNYSRRSNNDSIGSIDELILSLADDKSDTRNIGYKNNNELILTAYALSVIELDLMNDLYNSKDVHIYLNKWLRVNISGDNISKQEKRKFKDVTIKVELPKSYNITEL